MTSERSVNWYYRAHSAQPANLTTREFGIHLALCHHSDVIIHLHVRVHNTTQRTISADLEVAL